MNYNSLKFSRKGLNKRKKLMISPHFNELALIQTLGSLCSHMLLILLNEEPLSPAGYLHQGKPMITMAIFILSTTSWVVYSYIFLNESQGDNMAYNTQSMHLLAQGSMVMEIWPITAMFRLSKKSNSPFCQLVPLLGTNMHSFLVFLVTVEL